MLRMDRGLARNLPMTSRQNQPTMHLEFAPGPPDDSPKRRPARSSHEITQAYRPGTGRLPGVLDYSAVTGHLGSRGWPDDGRRIRLRPADEERRRTGSRGPQRRRRPAWQETG